MICREKKIGLLQSISLDDEQKKVRALIVSCGMRGKRIVSIEKVSVLAEGFILASEVRKYDRAVEGQKACFLRDTTGLLTGFITDYAFDEREKTILAIEIATGYSMHEFNRRIWVYEYHSTPQSKDELIVPAALGSELIYSEEGITCECLP